MSDLGKLHKWWLRKFRGGDTLGVDIDGYAGTPYGKALAGLSKRGLIKPKLNFGGLAVIELTPEGIAARDAL